MSTRVPSPETLSRLADAAGPGGALFAERDDVERYLVEWRGLFCGAAPLVLRPASTQAVADIVGIAHDTRTALVPQGGNTGLVGAQTPDASGAQVIISMERMSAVRGMDVLNNTMSVDAGATLASVQAAAAENNRLFPLSLASEGSCQIGGTISTNAGGTAVLRYGSMRDLVLGLEAVLPDGRVWDGMSGLRKDNTGYDLTRLLAGAEGTLGIITGAVLKLFPAPKATETAFIGVRDPQAALELLARLQDTSGGLVSTFELIARQGFELVLRHFDGASDPLAAPCQWYVLAEITAGTDGWLRGVFESALADAAGAGLVLDAVMADSEARRQALWALRENMSEAQKLEGASIKHDVSVPVSKVPVFLAQATEAVIRAMPGVRPMPFGHMGDGNIHFNLSCPYDVNPQSFLDQWQAMNDVVHGVVASLGGSISAEHGIGVLKREELTHYKSEVALDAMRAIKASLDPLGIMNPGKLI